MKIIVIILVVIIVVAGGVSLQMFFKNRKIPDNLGVKDGRLAPMPSSPNAVSSQTDDKEKYVDPIPFKNNLEDSKSAILEALNQYGNMEIITNTRDYLHAVSKTKTIGYRDDLEFYFDESKQLIQFRSASRVGYGDMGLNRSRYKKLVELYNQL